MSVVNDSLDIPAKDIVFGSIVLFVSIFVQKSSERIFVKFSWKVMIIFWWLWWWSFAEVYSY